MHQWSLAGLAVPALMAGGFVLSRGWGPPGLGWVVWTLVLTGPFIAFREFARRTCFASLQIKTAFWLDLGASLFQVPGLLLFAYLGALSATRAIGIWGLGAAAAGGLWLVWTRKNLAITKSGVASDWGRNWSFGKWILGGNLAIFLSYQAYPWILNTTQGTAVVAVLAACQGVMALGNPILRGTTNFLAPKAAQSFAKGGAAAIRAFVKKCTIVILPVAVLFCAAIIVYGGDLVSLIYGPQYAGFSLLISVLGLNFLINSLAFGVDYGIWAMGRPDLNFRIELIRLFITFTLGLWLVKTCGLMGVAWGLLIGSGVVAIMQGRFFFKLTSLKKENNQDIGDLHLEDDHL